MEEYIEEGRFAKGRPDLVDWKWRKGENMG